MRHRLFALNAGRMRAGGQAASRPRARRWLLLLLAAVLVLGAAPLPAPSFSSFDGSVQTAAAKETKHEQAKKKKDKKDKKDKKKKNKKKKKNRKKRNPPPAGCQFTKTATVWKLKANCTTTKTITIPNGVTLNGQSKTISLKGTPASFQNAGILANQGAANVTNLTLDGSGLSGTCNPFFVGIMYVDASGDITDVTVANIRPDQWCGDAIGVLANLPVEVNVKESQVSGAEMNGIRYIGRVTGTIASSSVTDTYYGIYVGDEEGPTEAAVSVADNDVQNASIVGIAVVGTGMVSTVQANDVQGSQKFGILVGSGAEASVSNNGITGGRAGFFAYDWDTDAVISNNVVTGAADGVWVQGATTDVTDNIFTGPGLDAGLDSYTDGVIYWDDGSGAIDRNAVSNYFDTNGTACGILIFSSPGLVAVGQDNTFPPPGNDENICDFSDTANASSTRRATARRIDSDLMSPSAVGQTFERDQDGSGARAKPAPRDRGGRGRPALDTKQRTDRDERRPRR